jgi:hypothetical protein
VSTEPALEIIVQHNCPKKCIPSICGKLLGQFTAVRVSKLAKQPLISYAMRSLLAVGVLSQTTRADLDSVEKALHSNDFRRRALHAGSISYGTHQDYFVWATGGITVNNVHFYIENAQCENYTTEQS